MGNWELISEFRLPPYVPVHLGMYKYLMFGNMDMLTNRSSLQREKVLVYFNNSNILVSDIYNMSTLHLHTLRLMGFPLVKLLFSAN